MNTVTSIGRSSLPVPIRSISMPIPPLILMLRLGGRRVQLVDRFSKTVPNLNLMSFPAMSPVVVSLSTSTETHRSMLPMLGLIKASTQFSCAPLST